jgi:phosphoglycerate dehydrogenase-like enzyme
MAKRLLRIHVENDPDGPAALNLTEGQFDHALQRSPALRGQTTVTFNDDPTQMAQRIAGAEVLFTCRKVSISEAQRASPELRWVQVISAGVDGYIDHLPKDVILTNASGVQGRKGAEFILTSVLMLNYQIPGFVTAKERKEWAPVFGSTLADKTITILGVGAIGKSAAELLRPFHVALIGVTRGGRSDASLDRSISVADLDSVLPSTDILVSTLPLTAETRYLIDRRRLNLLPDGAAVVVVGRADVFDYRALVDRLKSGSLSGAVLDVFPLEPVPPESELWTCPRLIMTPHCSLDDHGTYIDSCLEIFIDNLARHLSSTPLRNVVDRKLGY